MSVITFQCYACNQVLQVGADNAGKKAKCSQCGTILTIPALAADAVIAAEAVPQTATLPAAAVASGPKPPPVPRATEELGVAEEPPRRRRFQDDDEPPRRRRAEDRLGDRQGDRYDLDLRRPGPASWDKVKVGFLLVFIGLCVMAGAFGFVFLGMLVGFFSFMASRIMHQIGLTIFFLGTIPVVVGHVFWLFVPSNRRNSLGFAIAGLAVAGVYLIFQLVGVIQIFGAFFGISAVLILFVRLARAAHFMMIAFYVRSMAQLHDDPRLERSSMLCIILSGCLAGYDLLAGIILMAMASNFMGQGYVVTSSIFNLLGAACAIVLYVFLIFAVFGAKKLVEGRGADPSAFAEEPSERR